MICLFVCLFFQRIPWKQQNRQSVDPKQERDPNHVHILDSKTKQGAGYHQIVGKEMQTSLAWARGGNSQFVLTYVHKLWVQTERSLQLKWVSSMAAQGCCFLELLHNRMQRASNIIPSDGRERAGSLCELTTGLQWEIGAEPVVVRATVNHCCPLGCKVVLGDVTVRVMSFLTNDPFDYNEHSNCIILPAWTLTGALNLCQSAAAHFTPFVVW